jgi:hypothetical protein
MLIEAICNVFNFGGQPTFMDMNLEFSYQKLNSSIEWVYKQLKTCGTHILEFLKPCLRPKTSTNLAIVISMYE